MVQARHPNRLPDEQILALVPEQYREEIDELKTKLAAEKKKR